MYMVSKINKSISSIDKMNDETSASLFIFLAASMECYNFTTFFRVNSIDNYTGGLLDVLQSPVPRDKCYRKHLEDSIISKRYFSVGSNIGM